MIIVWVIGLILSFLGLWLLKNSRGSGRWYSSPEKGKPVLKVWSFTLLFICSIIPILGIFAGIAMIVGFLIQRGEGDWEFEKKDNRFIRFLNKPVK